MNLRGIGQSATLAINERSKALRREGRKIYGLGLGQSPFPIPQSVVDSSKCMPMKRLPARTGSSCSAHRRGRISYQERSGRHPPGSGTDRPGSKELMFLLQLVFYGEIILPSPSWVSYHPRPIFWADRFVSYIPVLKISGDLPPICWNGIVRQTMTTPNPGLSS